MYKPGKHMLKARHFATWILDFVHLLQAQSVEILTGI
jgi:hypothetical protein